MKKKISIIILFILTFINLNTSAQNIIENSSLKPGKYSVGFELVECKDYTRTSVSKSTILEISSNNKARKVRMYSWYPSKVNESNKNTLYDFFKAGVEDMGVVSDNSSLDEMIYDAPQFNRIPEAKIKALLKQECYSVEKAEKLEGQFPVIIIGQGYHYESPISHLILCEYLASHGYIVLTCPLFGTNSKAVELNMVDFETQIMDLEFLLSKALELPNADKNKIAALGFDLGAMSATVLQMKNSNIKALICFDGGIMFEHNTSRLLNPSPYYNPEKLNVPAMIFTRTMANNIEMGLKEDSTIFHQSIYSKKYLVRTKDMNHVFYTSYPSLGIESIPSPALSLKAYLIICNYSLNFFNSYLKQDQKSMQYLKDDPARFADNGVEISIEEFEAKKIPLNLSVLEYSILNRGITEGIRIYQESKAQNDLISEDELNVLGYKFLYNYGRAFDALSIFKLITDEYPHSANAFDSLGEAYIYIKDYRNALVNYKRALDLDPENINAKRIISQLEKVIK